MVKMTQQQFYCVKCRKRVTIPKDDICLRIVKNKKAGRDVPMLSGWCKECGVAVNKFVAVADVPKLAKKFKQC